MSATNAEPAMEEPQEAQQLLLNTECEAVAPVQPDSAGKAAGEVEAVSNMSAASSTIGENEPAETPAAVPSSETSAAAETAPVDAAENAPPMPPEGSDATKTSGKAFAAPGSATATAPQQSSGSSTPGRRRRSTSRSRSPVWPQQRGRSPQRHSRNSSRSPSPPPRRSRGASLEDESFGRGGSGGPRHSSSRDRGGSPVLSRRTRRNSSASVTRRGIDSTHGTASDCLDSEGNRGGSTSVSSGASQSQTHPPSKTEKKKRRTGWDTAPTGGTAPGASSTTGVTAVGLLPLSGAPSAPGDSAMTPTTTGFTATLAGKSPEQIQAELIERQAQAASIAASMQVKASASQMCRIYVGSLDYSLTDNDIRQVFSAFGPITNIDMPKEGSRSKGFCFVEYTNPESASMAIATMPGFNLKGRNIKVGRPTALGGQPSILSSAGGGLAGLGPKAGGINAAEAGQMAAAMLLAKQEGTGSPSAPEGQNRVYVGSVPYQFTAEDIKQIFDVFGTILSCQLIPSNERPGTHRGYGFIEYQTYEQAKLAIETMNDFPVAGKLLKVNYATALRAGKPAGGVGPIGGTMANATVLGGLPFGVGAGAQSLLLSGGVSPASTGANAIPVGQSSVQLRGGVLPGFPGSPTTTTTATNQIPGSSALGASCPGATGVDSNASAVAALTAVQQTGAVPTATALFNTPSVGVGGPAGFPHLLAAANPTAMLLLQQQQQQPQQQVAPSGQPMAVAPLPQTLGGADAGAMRNHQNSNILVLCNMVDPSEANSELKEEIQQECGKHGAVRELEMAINNNENAVRIFVVFDTVAEAVSALPHLHNRWFGGRRITSYQYDVDAYRSKNFWI